MKKKWFENIDNAASPLYPEIVRAIADGIASKTLNSGDRLPTYRELADELGISLGTVTRAYQEARIRGLIHGDGRRGTFIGLSGAAQSLSGVQYPKMELIDLDRYYPAPHNIPNIPAALHEISKRPESQQFAHYIDPQGLDRHRLAGSKWVARLGMDTDADSVVITAGAQNAIFTILFSQARHNDIIATESHTYTGLQRIVRAMGLRLEGVPVDSEGILPDALDKLCSQKKVRFLYCTPTIENPMNIIMSKSRCTDILSVCRKHNIIIIEDEINRALEPNPPPLLTPQAPDSSFLIASVSKVLAAGLRVCFVVPPAHMRDKMLQSVHVTNYFVSPLSVELVANWIEDGTADEVIASRRKEAVARNKIADEYFQEFEYTGQPHGYAIWLQLPKSWNPDKFTMAAYRKGVAIVPAHAFAVNQKQAANAVRVGLGGATNHQDLRKGLRVIRDLLKDTDTVCCELP